MTRIIDISSKRHLSAKLAAGIAISAMLTLGTFAGSAAASEYYSGDRYYSDYYGNGYYNDYYRSPYRYSDGPGVDIRLPFVGIDLR